MVWVTYMSEKCPEFIYKIISVGNGGVGKTSLALRYAHGTFREEYIVSIGVNFFSKDVVIDDVNIKLQIWDTGGQEKFKGIRPYYFKNADGTLLCFSITDRESFNDITDWYEQVLKFSPKSVFILVATKCDLNDNRKVSKEEIANFAKKLGVPFFETSAKEDVRVTDLFEYLARKIFEHKKHCK